MELPPAVATVAESADAKLGRDTVVLGMTELFGVVDAFVITSVQNTCHVRTLVEEIERGVKESHGITPARVEGQQDATWVLMDYGDFIAHVFLQETARLLRPRAPVVGRAAGGVAPRRRGRRLNEPAGRRAGGPVRARRSGIRSGRPDR